MTGKKTRLVLRATLIVLAFFCRLARYPLAKGEASSP